MISNIRIEDIGKKQSKYRILFNKNGDERVCSRTFSFKEDAQKVADKLQINK